MRLVRIKGIAFELIFLEILSTTPEGGGFLLAMIQFSIGGSSTGRIK